MGVVRAAPQRVPVGATSHDLGGIPPANRPPAMMNTMVEMTIFQADGSSNILGTMLVWLDHPGNIPLADSTLPNQQQLTASHHAREIRDRDLMLASAAPDVGQELLSGVWWNIGPQLGSRCSKVRQDIDGHDQIRKSNWGILLRRPGTVKYAACLSSPDIQIRLQHALSKSPPVSIAHKIAPPNSPRVREPDRRRTGADWGYQHFS